MKKLFVLSLISAVAISGAAFANSHEEVKADVKADVKAIHKDNAAIAKQDANLEENRAEKADAKAKGDVVDQASQSTQIGANKAVKALKKGEKAIDEKILEHHENKLEEKSGK